MSQRVVRVNELLKREISHVMHTRYRSETVSITVTEVKTAPDLRQAVIYYSISLENAGEAETFFRKKGVAIQQAVGRVVTLRYFPKMEFIRDDSAERGGRVNSILDELGFSGESESGTPTK